MDDRRIIVINCRLKQMPVSCRKLYKKAVAGGGLRACVDSQCLECMGYVREEVRSCTALACPLYAVRPYQKILKKASDDRIFNRKCKNSHGKDS